MSTAFPQGEVLPEERVICVVPDPVLGLPEGKLIKLRKSMCGPVDAPRWWFSRATKAIQYLGYKRVDADPCLYIKYGEDGLVRGACVLFVDDIIWFGDPETPWTLLVKLQEEWAYLNRL